MRDHPLSIAASQQLRTDVTRQALPPVVEDVIWLPVKQEFIT